MASPSTVLTLGFGSFGSVNLLPTLGYGIGAGVATLPGIEIKVPRRRLSVTVPRRRLNVYAPRRH